MIDVAFTRAQLRQADVGVVVDVLRATSTVAQALASGYRRVLCAESIARAHRMRAPGRVLAGERHCRKPIGFDLGNSPAEMIERRGDELVLATTNGAPAVVAAARHSSRVLLACLLNLDAVLEELSRAPDTYEVQIVCAGADGAAALEDIYVAGRIAAGLPGPRTDEARLAEAVAGAFDSPLHALSASAGAAKLRAANLAGDIARCARESELDLVPFVVAAEDGVAVVAAMRCRTTTRAIRVAVDASDTVSV